MRPFLKFARTALIVLALFGLCALCAFADPPACQCGPDCPCGAACPCDLATAKAKAAAMMGLAQAARQRVIAAATALPHCDAPIIASARAAGTPVLIWIGPVVEDLRSALPEFAHCSELQHQGDATPRLIVPTPSGDVYWLRSDLKQITPKNIRDVHSGRVSLNAPPAGAVATPLSRASGQWSVVSGACST